MAAMNWVTHVGSPAFPTAPAAHELLAYPNPARDHVWIAGMTSARGNWVLCDQRGQGVDSGEATPWFQVGLAELPMGVFILRTTEPNGHQRTVRIVKTTF